jgi:hypothetical protein
MGVILGLALITVSVVFGKRWITLSFHYFWPNVT